MYNNFQKIQWDPHILDPSTKWDPNIFFETNIFSPGGRKAPPGLKKYFWKKIFQYCILLQSSYIWIVQKYSILL